MAPYAVWAATSVLISGLLVTFAPKYSIGGGSYAYTALSIYIFQSVTYFFYWVLIYPTFVSPLRHLPQPKGHWPILGHFIPIFRETSGKPPQRWINEIPNSGLIRYVHLFGAERVLVTTSRALGEVLVQKNYEFIKPAMMRAGLSRILGVGLLLAEGDEHKTQRKNLMPAFAFRHVKDLYPVFWSKTAELVSAIESEIRSNPVVEIGAWASRATLDIVGLAGMGHDFGAIADPNAELSRTYNKVFAPPENERFLGLLQFVLPRWILHNLPIKRNEDIFSAANTIKRICRELIQAKRVKMEEKKQTGIDILSVALSSGLFTDEQLVNQMMTFLVAGHETTATATQWAVYNLAKEGSKYQDMLREEVRANLPSITDSSTITPSQLDDHLPYLHAFCNEILRFHSPVPLTLREAAHDTSIQGHPIPQGTKVILCPWAINFSHDLWGPDADRFLPERWIGQGKANTGGARSNYALLTFLHGPRSCIGQGFAKAEFACLIAGLIGRFSFELEDPDMQIDYKGGITSKPKHGVRVRVKVVDGW